MEIKHTKNTPLRTKSVETQKLYEIFVVGKFAYCLFIYNSMKP